MSTHGRYLLDELDAGSQVHPEVDECPLNAFLLVFLLLQHKHVVVEELLQFLIGEVDAQLLQAVILTSKHNVHTEGYTAFKVKDPPTFLLLLLVSGSQQFNYTFRCGHILGLSSHHVLEFSPELELEDTSPSPKSTGWASPGP